MKLLVRVLYWPGRFVFKVLLSLIVKVEVIGLERLPRRGGLVVASNHLNNADPPVLATTLNRRLVFMAKREAMGWPIVGMIIRLTGAFPVRRFEADLGALRKATELLREGQVVTMFPEGTRSLEAALGMAHPGTALIALRTGVPIVPVAITGTEQVHFPKVIFRAIRLNRPRVRVVIGDPFFLPGIDRITAEEVWRCTDIIMTRIAALLPPRYRGKYASTEQAAQEKAQ